MFVQDSYEHLIGGGYRCPWICNIRGAAYGLPAFESSVYTVFESIHISQVREWNKRDARVVLRCQALQCEDGP